MASQESIHSSLKILDLSTVSPSPSPSQKVLLPLTCFDLLWLRFHPVERIFFYSLPHLQSSHFFDSILPKLKHSLSLTLHHFLPLSGRLLWPSHSSKPFIQFIPGDSVSVIVAISKSDFNILLQDSPNDASLSRPLVPHLDSSASIFSLQITLFPNSGFCIGITTHHAVFDGKSSTMFMKAWAYLCKQGESESSSSLLPSELEPFFDREAIIEPYSSFADSFVNEWMHTNNNQPSLKIMHEGLFSSNIDQSTRATFHLTRGDLEKIKKRVLEKWDQNSSSSKPPSSLSTFVVTIAYTSFCVAKAISKVETEKEKPLKFLFGIPVDCRGRLKHSVPQNYFGNCVMGRLGIEIFSEEDGLVVVARILHDTTREMLEKGVLDGANTVTPRILFSLQSERVQGIGVAGSTRFEIYGSDFGWGRPEKVEITSVDRGISIGMAESKDGNGGVELGLVLNQHVMDCFATLIHSEKESLRFI